MFNSLYSKLAAVLCGLFVMVGITYVLITIYSTRIYVQEISQNFNVSLAKNLVSWKKIIENGQTNNAELKKIFDTFMYINPGIQVYLLDDKGKILSYSASPDLIKHTHVDLTPIKEFLKKDHMLPILGDDPRNVERQTIFSAAPVDVNGTMEGYLYVVLSSAEAELAEELIKKSHILRLSLWVILGSLFFALLAGLLFFNFFTRRLNKLSKRMLTFQKEGFDTTKVDLCVDTKTDDEIGQLSKTFYKMGIHISNQVKQLKQADTMRRELVANVSHDLRTPITLLQGYLETLLIKENNLSAGEYHKYLNIALQQGKRLGILVDDLFELAKLESGETVLKNESIAIIELIQDMLLQYQLKFENKNIQLETRFPNSSPLVYADIALIERVLQNLIENALRYTPDGGIITVELISENNKIDVSVKDTGDGIPPEKIDYIFDRYYQVERNEQKPIHGAGLGLAIAKRILELHGSAINVNSILNVGTEFYFTLPVHQT